MGGKTLGQRPHGAVQTGSPPALSNESTNTSPPQGWKVDELEALAAAWRQELPKGYPPAWNTQTQEGFSETYVPQSTHFQNSQQLQSGHVQDYTDELGMCENSFEPDMDMDPNDLPLPEYADFTTFLNSGNEAPACVNPRDIMFDRGR